MNRILLSIGGVFAASVCLAQYLGTSPAPVVASRQEVSSKWVCQLGSDCLNVNKTPVKACLVAKGSKAPDGCASDGMKFVSKLATGEKFRS